MLKQRCVRNLFFLYLLVAGIAYTVANISFLNLDEVASDMAVPVAVQYTTPVPVPKPKSELTAGTIVWLGPEDKNQVALTFDDGPNPEYTPQILAVLDRYHVKATFFMVGEMARQYPGVVREVADQGNEVADHTMTHPEAPKVDSQGLMQEVGGAAQLLERISGRKVHYFRPPYGYFDVAYFQTCRDNNMDVVLWSIVPRDWEQPPAEVIVRRVASEIRPGAIVLLHDGGGNRRQTVKALPLIIEAIQAKGLKPVTLSQLLE
ncbi:MAG: polysaccharide deacetylase family protein [Bacillota bacterium]|nr:polysaccharide deacetylase family protein [Bacillota bacterium]